MLSWHRVVFVVATAIVSWVGTAEMTPEHDLDSWLTYAPLLGPLVTGIWYGARTGAVKTEMMLPLRTLVQALVPPAPMLAVRDPKALLTGQEDPDRTVSPAARATAALTGAILLLTLPAGVLVAVGTETLDHGISDINIPETFSRAAGVLAGSGDNAGWVALAVSMRLLVAIAVLIGVAALARKRSRPEEQGERLFHPL